MGKSKKKKKEKVIYFCDGKKCCRYNDEVKDCLKSLVEDSGLIKVSVEKMKCQGMCKQAPVICIHKKECVGNITAQDARKLFEKHIA